jgi:hypothetical protein
MMPLPLGVSAGMDGGSSTINTYVCADIDADVHVTSQDFVGP